jgi:hypothetical protein
MVGDPAFERHNFDIVYALPHRHARDDFFNGRDHKSAPSAVPGADLIE